MNIADLAEITVFPMQIEALKAAMKIAQDADKAVMAAEAAGCDIEDTVELSDIAKQLFSAST